MPQNLLELVICATLATRWESLSFRRQGAALICGMSSFAFPRYVDDLGHLLGDSPSWPASDLVASPEAPACVSDSSKHQDLQQHLHVEDEGELQSLRLELANCDIHAWN